MKKKSNSKIKALEKRVAELELLLKNKDKENHVENLKKLLPGTLVRLTEEHQKWHGKHAFESNTVGNCITTESSADDYVGYKLIEAGLYEMQFVEFRTSVGDGPGIKARINFPQVNIPPKTAYFDAENVVIGE